MAKLITQTTLSETLTLSEFTDGFWLYDETREMNLSMKAKTETEALVETITYYQNRLREVEQQYTELFKHVKTFVQNVNENIE